MSWDVIGGMPESLKLLERKEMGGSANGNRSRLGASQGVSLFTLAYAVNLIAIASFGAFTRSCLVPRYRSVVCTDACPNSI